MTTAQDVLTRSGLANVPALLAAVEQLGMPLHIAAAFAQQESGGRNVYGHDSGGVFAVPGGTPVTKQNYADFYTQVVDRGRTSNGVGPMQITYRGYFPLAGKKGLRLWVPQDNFIFGLGILKDYLKSSFTDASINRAGQRYNSGSPTGAPGYGSAVVRRARTLRQALSGTTPIVTVDPLPDLSLGSTGNAVRQLQIGLNRFFPLYSHLAITGTFDKPTDAVVREFQRRAGLSVDGVVGDQTRTALAGFGVTL